MKIYIYVKSTEDITMFYRTVQLLYLPEKEVLVSTEERRAFRELNNIKKKCSGDDIVIIGSLKSLGVNIGEAADQLQWFIDNSVPLVICDINTTYTFGVSQPMNKAVLGTILQSILENDGKVVRVAGNRRSNSGRNKIEFPEGWEVMFDQWEKGEFSSKEFLERSGLKKATFYNLITEYKRLRDLSEQFEKKFLNRA